MPTTVQNVQPCPAAEPALALPGPANPVAGTPIDPNGGGVTTSIEDYFRSWFARVDEARASQPHWAAPLVTTSGMLFEQVAVDEVIETVATGARVVNIGDGKGLGLIPATQTQVTIAIPSYQWRDYIKPANGLTDLPFLLLKQRLFSANAQDGNYVVSAVVSTTAPIGIRAFTTSVYYVNGSLAAGKGVGNFDVQVASGLALPTTHQDTLGTAWTTNLVAQVRDRADDLAGSRSELDLLA